MRIFQISLLFLIFVGFSVQSCESNKCNTADEFLKSYVAALVKKDLVQLKKHYVSESHTCYLDRFSYEGEFIGFNVSSIKELSGKSLNEFHEIWDSEFTKTALFYENKLRAPKLSHKEIMGVVYKKLANPNYKRKKLVMDVVPDTEIQLRISNRLYSKGHACYEETSTSSPIFLKNTTAGYKAIEPYCDIKRVTGHNDINQERNNNKIDSVFNKLSRDSKNQYVKEFSNSSLITLMKVSKDLNISFNEAKYLMYEKICSEI